MPAAFSSFFAGVVQCSSMFRTAYARSRSRYC
jgi:hypothetical protein